MKFPASLAAFLLFVCAAFGQEAPKLALPLVGTFDASIVADNSFTLFLNGEKVAEGASWNTPVETTLTLKAGDVLCAIVKDDEGGKSGGLLFLLKQNKKLVATGAMFKYTVSPAEDWLTNPATTGYLTTKLTKNEGLVMLGITNPKYAWGSPRQLTPILYFKFVNK